MFNFDQRWEDAPDWQRENFMKFTDKIDLDDFNDNEKRYLLWLCSFDKDTLDAFSGIFAKIKNNRSE